MTATVATVGTFDGIHRGHQAVLEDVVRRARAGGLVSLLVTFDPHPLLIGQCEQTRRRARVHDL